MLIDFLKVYISLTPNQQCLISNTMVDMEHSVPAKEIDIKYGIHYGRILKEYTVKEMLALATPIYKQSQEQPIIDDNFKLDNIFASMISRNSRGSGLFPILLDLLDINESLIRTCYFSHFLNNIEFLFSTLLPCDKEALMYPMRNLNTDYTISPISNIGITKENATSYSSRLLTMHFI